MSNYVPSSFNSKESWKSHLLELAVKHLALVCRPEGNKYCLRPKFFGVFLYTVPVKILDNTRIFFLKFENHQNSKYLLQAKDI